jgi:hypothetical protein
MRVRAALEGNLRQFLEQETRDIAKAVTKGVTEATLGLKTELRGQVTQAGLGERLARTWQHKRYPATGESLETAGFVYNKFPQVIRAFNENTMIKSKKGLFLAIPTSSAPKRRINGKRISPDTFPEASLGTLRFVYRSHAPSLLVVDHLKATLRGRFKKATQRAIIRNQGITTVVMFILLPQVQLKKRLDLQTAQKRWITRLATLILQYWPAHAQSP